MTNPIIYVLFLLALCSSCGQTADRSSDETPDTTAVKLSRVDSMMMEISRTPDSLRTPEQLETIRKVQLMVARYVEVEIFSHVTDKRLIRFYQFYLLCIRFKDRERCVGMK